MSQEQLTISYDEFMPQPVKERIKLCMEISPENRVEIMKTHITRWLEANRHRLTPEQVAMVEEEFIPFIIPEAYRPDRDSEKIMRQAEALEQKAKAIFTHEDLRQIASEHADHVPAV